MWNLKDCLPSLPLKTRKENKKIKVFLSRQFCVSLSYVDAFSNPKRRSWGLKQKLQNFYVKLRMSELFSVRPSGFFFQTKCREGEIETKKECLLQSWTRGWCRDTGWHRTDTTSCCGGISTHQPGEVRSKDHGYFQSRFRVPVYKEVDRPTHGSIKREQALEKVKNVFMTQINIPTDTNQLSKLPIGTMWRLGGWTMSRPDVVRELLSTHSDWLRMWKKVFQ